MDSPDPIGTLHRILQHSDGHLLVEMMKRQEERPELQVLVVLFPLPCSSERDPLILLFSIPSGSRRMRMTFPTGLT